MDSDEILKRVKCCVSGEPLVDCEHVNWVQTRYKAKWPYPCHGNLITKEEGMAVAYIHDRYMDGKAPLDLKWVVEFREGENGEEVVYHDVTTLEWVKEKSLPQPGRFFE